MPVLEALRDERLAVARLAVATNARGPAVDDILAEAARRGIRAERLPADRVTRISGNGRHDQGVAATVEAPRIAPLGKWLAGREGTDALTVVVLDGVTNPANVGMVVRTVTAAGMDGVVLPAAGGPDVGPLVIKASAGVAFDAPILRAPTAPAALEALAGARFRIYGLASPAASPAAPASPASSRSPAAAGSPARSLFDGEGFARRSAFVFGNETTGVSAAAAALVHEWVSIPLAGEVESLNVAVAAGVVCFELLRRRLDRP